MMEITRDEYMAICISRQVVNDEIVAQGIATPLIAAAYLLARHTHAPNLYFVSAIGQGICRQPAPLSLTRVESLWLDHSLINVGFIRAAADILPCLRPKEFFRPAQIDPHGNFNNISFTKEYKKPHLRLPGTGGIPDLTPIMDDIYLYVPRLSRLTFVPKLDFLSGLGHNPTRKFGEGPKYLVTDLGEFDFKGGQPLHKSLLRLTTYNPGVTITRIKARTGFEFEISPDVHESPTPTEEEIHLLREKIDPSGIRRLGLLSGTTRRQLLRKIVQVESRSNDILH